MFVLSAAMRIASASPAYKATAYAVCVHGRVKPVHDGMGMRVDKKITSCC
jgi:hypothetical protein